MTEFLLKIRVSVKRVFTPILWLTLTPLNYDMGFVIKALLSRLIQLSDPCLVLISLGLIIGDLGDSRFNTTVPFSVSTQYDIRLSML